DRRVSGFDRCDAEIRTDRGGALQRQARSARKTELSCGNDSVHKEIAGDAFFATEALPDFAGQSQPLYRPIFGKGAGLQGEIDVAQAIARGVSGGLSPPNDLGRGAGFALGEV